MSHIENIKRLFGNFKALNDKQSNAHHQLEQAQVALNQYPIAVPQVAASLEKLTFLKGKSAVFFREFEKLRGELNSYKNTPEPDPSLVLAFDKKLAFIQEKQSNFLVEIEGLNSSLAELDGSVEMRHPQPDSEQESEEKPKAEGQEAPPQQATGAQNQSSQQRSYTPPPPPRPKKKKEGEMDSAEVFVGQKLFSYIGIGILVIGLGLGVKVALDKGWFGEIFQIVGGYSAAAILIILGLWLKKKYEGFSVVLVGGGLATAYFMTYASHAYFGYFNQLTAFSVMVVLTGVTVFTALKYNQELIAILGMVGAYGVPFLLNDGSGNVQIMFTYMAIINAGILVIAFKKYWRGLYYSAFGLTWLIFGTWFITEYKPHEHFHLAVIFMSAFFVTFYSAFLSHKLIQKEDFHGGDIALVLINSILFFAIGYYILDSTAVGREYQGLFALANAAFHFVITIVFYIKKMADKSLFHIEAGMVLLFVTIAIPIQFDGEWIPIFWTLEALVLFILGRVQGIKVYEILSYPMSMLAFLAVCKSVMTDYAPYLDRHKISAEHLPFLSNEVFMGAALACLGFALIAMLNKWKAKRPEQPNGWQTTMDYLFPIMTFSLIYFTFFFEISTYWNQEYNASMIAGTESGDWLEELFSRTRNSFNRDILKFKTISLLDFTLIYLGALAILNWAFWKNKNFGVILTSVSMFGILIYAILGSVMFSDLSESLTDVRVNSKYHLEASRVYMYKYMSLLIFVAFTAVQYTTSRALKLGESFSQWNAGLIHLCALIVISHEFLFLADMNGLSGSTKTALSVMWAAYAVVLMAIGIRNKRGYLRISAFVIWGVVLTKLLLYDLTHLSTEVKTLVFISIGVLLLIVSFLYYRVVAKQRLEEEEEEFESSESGSSEETGYQKPE